MVSSLMHSLLFGTFHICGRQVPVPVLVVTLFVLMATSYTARALTVRRRQRRAAETIYAQKRQKNLKAIQEVYDKLRSDKRLVSIKDGIVSLPTLELLEQLRKGRLLAVDVIRAYQLKALEVNERLNCVVEAYKEAEVLAEELDRMETKGPLHGLPISLKDQYALKGYDTHTGLAKAVGKFHQEDCAVVKVLKKLGAVPIVKTTVPQTMFSYECSNPIDGATSNACQPSRSAGGSSGGEGALIGAGGSLVGMGSDIIGSIRVPAHVNGICGIKPCYGRISTKGVKRAFQSETAVPAVFGSLAREVDGLVLMMKALLSENIYKIQRTMAPVGFRNELFEEGRPLRIGWMTSEMGYTPLPPCQRAVTVARDILMKQGHTLVPFEWGAARMKRCMEDLLMMGLFGDEGTTFGAIIEGENVDKAVDGIMMGMKHSALMRRIIGYLYTLLGNKVGKYYTSMAGCRTTKEWWNLLDEIHELREGCVAYWNEQRLDALLCPVGTYIAFNHGDSNTLIQDGRFWGFAYCALYNILDFPAGVVPITKVTKADIKAAESFPTPHEAERVAKRMMVGSEGLPVGVQCVVLPWQEERCLRVMKQLEVGAKD